MKRIAHHLDSYLYYYLLALVLIMPLHAFLAIGLGHLVGHQAVWQAWKEAGLVLGGLSAVGLFVRQPQTRGRIIAQPASWSAAVFIATALFVSLATRTVSFGSFLLGAKTTLAFLVLFIIIQAATFTQARWRALLKTLLIISSAIGLFAVAQVSLLPPGYLIRFGYGPSTVLPFHLVDPAVASIRIIGTFSGPNQLGSFMVIPLVLSAWLVLRKKWLALVPFLLSSYALFHSYSRSAWIGAAVALFVMLLLRLKGWWKLALLAPIAAVCIAVNVLSGPVKAMSTDLTFYVFHGQFVDGHTNGSDSNRLKNAQRGLDTIKVQPLGHGLGTAGPASKDTKNPIITENSYLQIGIETGIIGLLLFIATLILTGIALWKQSNVVDEAKPLLAILAGLCVTNLFLHTWADSATALVLWGLIGYSLTAPKRSKA